jgi:uncharacterized protein (TIGR03083 family)
VDTVHLMPGLRAELLDLLESLHTAEWQRPTPCPGWSVHALACHLLGVELGNISVRRDGWKIMPTSDEDPDKWLNAFNQQWVDAAKRISPAVVINAISEAGERFDQYLSSLDLDATGNPVGWATGTSPAPVWLDVAREYMERLVHQAQLREALSRPPLGPNFLGPAVATAVHALPGALGRLTRPAGTSVMFTAEGEGGATWAVVRGATGWELNSGSCEAPACEVRTTLEGALRLFVRDPAAPALAWKGDPELARAVERTKAVLG